MLTVSEEAARMSGQRRVVGENKEMLAGVISLRVLGAIGVGIAGLYCKSGGKPLEAEEENGRSDLHF